MLKNSKGIFPFSYVTSLEKLHEGMVSKEKFFSDLTKRGITDNEYAQGTYVRRTYVCTTYIQCKRLSYRMHFMAFFSVLEMYKLFNCRSLCDYARYYCWSDSILLLEAIHDLRMTLFGLSNLDIAYYLSLPGEYDSSSVRL